MHRATFHIIAKIETRHVQFKLSNVYDARTVILKSFGPQWWYRVHPIAVPVVLLEVPAPVTTRSIAR